MSKEAVTGVKQDQLEKQGRDSLEAALGAKVEAQKTEEPETAPAEEAKQETQPQDANPELSKYDNILKNTFGFTDEEINDKARKAAKSWSETQSIATKAKQEASQHKQIVDNLNAVLEKYPSLYDQLHLAAKGQYVENPQKQEPIGQPTNKGELDYDVSEDELVRSGYLKAEDLEGMDELSKQRKILRAEARYIREQESKNYMNDIKTQQENLRKQQEIQRLTAENKRRAEEGFDNFVRSYGVNFAELEPDVINQIQKRMQYTLDPSNPNLIAEDAFEIAASRVLNLTPQPTSQKKDVAQITDTGRTFTKATKPEGKTTMADELKKRAYQQFLSNNDPKSKYKSVS